MQLCNAPALMQIFVSAEEAEIIAIGVGYLHMRITVFR